MSTLAENRIQGVIFDMDGVLFDTEVLYERFWCEAARRFGFHMTPEHVAAIRSTDSHLAAQITKRLLGNDFDYAAVRNLRKKLMQDYIEKNGITVKPGVRETLQYFRAAGYKIALATTSNQGRAERYLALTGLRQYFDVLICGDMISRGKPDPMIYETAAQALSLRPEQCMAFEDSYNGVRSAFTAGCKVCMVPDRDMPDEEMRQKAMVIERPDVVIKS